MSILCVISTIYCASFKFFCMWCLKSILCDEHFLQESQELFQWKINLHLIILVLYLIANFSIDNASSWCDKSLSHNIKWDSTEKTFKKFNISMNSRNMRSQKLHCYPSNILNPTEMKFNISMNTCDMFSKTLMPFKNLITLMTRNVLSP